VLELACGGNQLLGWLSCPRSVRDVRASGTAESKLRFRIREKRDLPTALMPMKNMGPQHHLHADE
jgi:hypothetical protein